MEQMPGAWGGAAPIGFLVCSPPGELAHHPWGTPGVQEQGPKQQVSTELSCGCSATSCPKPTTDS